MIFLSYSRLDSAEAYQVKATLEEWGHRVFLDLTLESGITPGADWKRALYRQLRASTAIIALWSQNSVSSRWCIAELTFGDATGKQIFPVRLDSTPLDPVLLERQAISIGELDRLRAVLEDSRVSLVRRGVWASGEPPYPGMLPFGPGEESVFFGRDQDVQRGVERLTSLRRTGGARFLIVVGQSGTGKSSLVRAGWMPALARRTREWIVVGPIRPGSNPGVWTATAFAAAGQHVGLQWSGADVEERLTSAPDALAALSDELRAAALAPESSVLVVVDQLEELLDVTAGPVGHRVDEPARASLFLAQLNAAVRATDMLLVVGTLRSDFLAAFEREAATAKVAFEPFPLLPMSEEDVRRAIAEPAEAAGAALEEGLADAMIEEVGGNPALPMLANVLRRLWVADAPKKVLTRATLEAFGGVRGAIDADANAIVAQLSEDEIGTLRTALFAMVRVTGNHTVARQTARWKSLPERAHGALNRFVAARLLVSGDGVGGPVLEPAHEALFTEWGLLSGWIDEHWDTLVLIDRLKRDAADWDAAGRPRSYTWHGERLERTAALESAALGEPERAFITASWTFEKSSRSERTIALQARLEEVAETLSELDGEEERAEFDPARTAEWRRQTYARVDRIRREEFAKKATIEAALRELHESPLEEA